MDGARGPPIRATLDGGFRCEYLARDKLSLVPHSIRPSLPLALGRLWRRLHGLPGRGVEIDAHAIFLGTEYGGYAVLPALLSRESVVYSAGLGEDISFDLELIERVGCTVHGFDPTPRSAAWLASRTLPESFVFHPYGFADFDGSASFAPPQNPAHVSHTLLEAQPGERVSFPVRRFQSVLRELGHASIDLLKMDIEGAEYGVLEDMLAHGPLPKQLLVEFHHKMAGVPLARTERALAALRAAGYRVFEARGTGREFSLVLESALA